MTACLRIRAGIFRHWRFLALSRDQIATQRQFSATLLALTMVACGTQDMNVVVFNYWPRAMADVYVDGQHVGAGFGAYGPGGTGGSISCCSSIRAGKTIEVKWMMDGPASDPMTGKIMQAKTILKEIKPGARYLGVYLYPDGSVALDTARGIPDDLMSPERK